MGGDNFPKIRCHQRTQGKFAHLPNHKILGVDGSKGMFIRLLDHFLQVTDELIFSNVNGESAGGIIKNPTENCENII